MVSCAVNTSNQRDGKGVRGAVHLLHTDGQGGQPRGGAISP